MHRPNRLTSAVCITLSTALAIACGGDEVVGTTDTPDTSVATETTSATVTDTFTPFETTTAPPTDTGEDVATAPSDTSVDSEVTLGCNTFGCTCEGNDDCLDGYCIEGIDGQVCTRTCIESCPSGFECVQTLTAGDPVNLCVPQFTRICRPCDADADCQAASDPYPAYCVTDDDPRNGSFCAASCASRECPEGFTCADVTTQGGAPARQCVPSSGECTCRPSWSGLGFTTDCKVVNAFGACDGTRTCGPNGLSACTGELANPELCDGEDNDCNGTTDDIPAVACLVTNQYGSCSGTTACGVGQPTCVGPEAGPETCDGQDDNCNGQTDEGSCDDGLTCTTDSCRNGSECEHPLAAGQCLINGACWSSSQFNPLNACELCDPARSTVTWSQTANTCVIGGSCYPSGAVNPQNACQICNPNQSSSGWTTAGNTCQIGGQCYLANDANPANACEICVPSTSTTAWTQATNTCNIVGQCYAAGVKKPGEPCFLCDPSRSATGWSAAALNTTCDDASPCSTDDHCDGAGTCVGNKSCNDGIACTQDICGAGGCNNTQVTAGQCRIGGVCWNQQNQNPSNQCQWCNPGSTQTAWSNKPTTEGCSDGNGCTLNDFCSGGSCSAGSAKVCSDSNACTADTCNPVNGQCSYPAQAGSCDDNDGCTNPDTCSSGTCTGTPDLDDYEPNSAGAPRHLGSVDDSEDFDDDGRAFAATLYTSGDEDWYTVDMPDSQNAFSGEPLPRVRLSPPSTQNYNLCAYYTCTNGSSPSIDCDGDTASTYSGMKGCCSNASGSAADEIRYEPNCDTLNDSGRLYIRVFSATGFTCSDYTLRYGDD